MTLLTVLPAIVLSMIEDDELGDDWVLAHPVPAIRQISRACMNAFDPATFRSLYENQMAWRVYLQALA